VALLDDQTLIGRVLDHLDGGTTDLSDDTWREPVENYRSPDRLRREVETVLRRQPVAFCPSAALPEAGSYVARRVVGVPLVAVRGRDGHVRAFRNACRHRGTALVSGEGCAQSLVCPYHGWVYRLDGALRHVPDEHGFPGLDRSQRGLVPVSASERAGLVFVNQDGPPGAAEVLDDLPELIGADQAVLDSNEIVVDANWKVLVEGFLEGYHIKATHPETFFPFGYDNVTVVETVGRHSRVTFPFRRIEALRGVPADERRIDGMATVVHHVFPNAIVARLSHHTAMVVLEPTTTDRTTLVTYRLASRRSTNGDGGSDGVKADVAAAARDTDFVKLGAVEDRDIACAVQIGLASGANEVLEFGRFEGAITHFHRQLGELLADGSGSRP
jgi:phenylpropionate dioxygenase-like ring-hydroxylating dioxygenase large terminal subunit